MLDALVVVILVPTVASLYRLLLGVWLTLPAGALTGWAVVVRDERLGLPRDETPTAGR
ncbi:hypothetical protein VB773_04165 [Haloarculaceae archaeon H-GB2-1]|nr:hypothetical protein [Haloarculaceae archaeon H-GB2-1]